MLSALHPLLFEAMTLGSDNYYHLNLKGKETEVQRELKVMQQVSQNQNQLLVTDLRN